MPDRADVEKQASFLPETMDGRHFLQSKGSSCPENNEPYYLLRILNSTRLFFALPSAVSLGAMGCEKA